MNVMVFGEESQAITIAFRNRGFNAFSCDLKPCSGGHPEWHYRMDGIELVKSKIWDLIIFHPCCRYMAVSGNAHHSGSRERTEAIKWTLNTWDIICKHSKCSVLENPVSVIFSYEPLKNPQYIQPHDFGEDASKKTGLKLRNLPILMPTKYIEPRIVNGKKRWANQTDSGQNKLPPSETRGEERSKTYPGISDAMADQWGNYLLCAERIGLL
jgi:hypothetical protein